MKKSSFAAVTGGAAFACGLAFASGVASAQGLGAGAQGKADPAQIQQKIQEQTQQRLQAQAEAQARVRAEAQAQQAAARMQQRVEAQAQNQAARAQAQGERALGVVQQRLDAATQARASAGASASAAARVGQQNVHTQTQAEFDLETDSNSPGLFGPWNPIRAAAGLTGTANARGRGNSDGGSQGQPTEGEVSEEEAKRPSQGLRVGQFTDLRGTARAELARSMALRLTAISAMRDRAIESEDLQLLEKADRLEDAVRRVLDARARGAVDAEAEAVVEAEMPAPSAPNTEPVEQTDATVEVAPSATFVPTTQP